MNRLTKTAIASLAVVALTLCTRSAIAAGPHSFHCSGSGLFAPTNIGTARGGNAGIIIGDGTGVSQYIAQSNVFTIDEVLVGTGFNLHTGEVLSRTTGILKKRRALIRWPAKSGASHVLSSDEGDIEFKYIGGFTLDPAIGSFTADALFFIVGGTGRFAGARGIVWVDVAVPFALPGPPPPGVSPDIPFNYDFNGFILLDD